MLQSLTSRELSEWQAFERDYGPVWIRPDFAQAMIVSTLANIHRDPKRHKQPYEVRDFLIGGALEYEPTPEQVALMADLNAALFAQAEPEEPE